LVVLPILVDRLESMREELSKRFPIVPADVLSVHSNAKPCKALEVVVQGKGVRCHKAPESTGLKVLSTSLRENTRVPEMFDEVRGNYHGEFSSELEGLSVRNSDVIALHLTTLDFTRRGVDSQRRPSRVWELGSRSTFPGPSALPTSSISRAWTSSRIRPNSVPTKEIVLSPPSVSGLSSKSRYPEHSTPLRKLQECVARSFANRRRLRKWRWRTTVESPHRERGAWQIRGPLHPIQGNPSLRRE